MLLIVIKVLAFILTGLVIVKSYLAYRQRQETIEMFLFWSLTRLAIIAIAFNHDLITKVLLERRVGVGSFLGVSLVFVYFVIYRVYVKADRIEKELYRLTRELSLKPTETVKPTRRQRSLAVNKKMRPLDDKRRT